jgi:hypothetical protein
MKCIKGASFMLGGASKMHDPVVANYKMERHSEIRSSEFKLDF